MKKICIIVLLSLCFMQQANAQQTILLYENKVPNSKPYTTKEYWEPVDNGDTIVHFISQPTLTLFLPAKKMQMEQR